MLRQNTLRNFLFPVQWGFQTTYTFTERRLHFPACACVIARIHVGVDLPASSREHPFTWYLGNYILHFALQPAPPPWVNINYGLHLNFVWFYTCLSQLHHAPTNNLYLPFGTIHLPTSQDWQAVTWRMKLPNFTSVWLREACASGPRWGWEKGSVFQMLKSQCIEMFVLRNNCLWYKKNIKKTQDWEKLLLHSFFCL